MQSVLRGAEENSTCEKSSFLIIQFKSLWEEWLGAFLIIKTKISSYDKKGHPKVTL